MFRTEMVIGKVLILIHYHICTYSTTHVPYWSHSPVHGKFSSRVGCSSLVMSARGCIRPALLNGHTTYGTFPTISRFEMGPYVLLSRDGSPSPSTQTCPHGTLTVDCRQCSFVFTTSPSKAMMRFTALVSGFSGLLQISSA